MKVANWKQRTLVFIIDYGLLFLACFLLALCFKDNQFNEAFIDLWNKIKTFSLHGDDVILFFERLSTLTALFFTIGAIFIYILYFVIF